MKKIIALLIVACFIAAPVFAAQESPWKGASCNYCGEKVEKKFCYGITNALFGWTELFSEPYESRSNAGDFVKGLGRGVWNAVGDTVGGALHAVTFWCPKTDVPLPEGGLNWCSVNQGK